MVDGTDIRRMTQASLRRNIGIVQQDVFLFSDSVRDNITYGRIGASDDEIAVSYTHLDVYKRQTTASSWMSKIRKISSSRR